MSIILHEVNGVQIGQRESDGFINATAMCAAHGKLITNWLQNKDTFELFLAVAHDLGCKVNYWNPNDLDASRLSASDYARIFPDLIFVKRGSPENGGGTWLYSDLAMQNAQWCSKPFAIQVSRWVRELSTTGKVELNQGTEQVSPLLVELQTLTQLADLRDRLQLEFTKQERDVIKSRLITLIAPDIKPEAPVSRPKRRYYTKQRSPKSVQPKTIQQTLFSEPSEHHFLDFARDTELVEGSEYDFVYVGEIWEQLKVWYIAQGAATIDENGALEWVERSPLKGRLARGSNQVAAIVCALLPYAKKGKKDVKGMKIMGVRFN